MKALRVYCYVGAPRYKEMFFYLPMSLAELNKEIGAEYFDTWVQVLEVDARYPLPFETNDLMVLNRVAELMEQVPTEVHRYLPELTDFFGDFVTTVKVLPYLVFLPDVVDFFTLGEYVLKRSGDKNKPGVRDFFEEQGRWFYESKNAFFLSACCVYVKK